RAGDESRNSCHAPSASNSRAISGEKNSPQTLWRGNFDFSTTRTAEPSRRAAMAADAPAGPPPRLVMRPVRRATDGFRRVLARLRQAVERAAAVRQIVESQAERGFGFRILAGLERDFADRLIHRPGIIRRLGITQLALGGARG